MATEAQISANQQNAKLSTGPTSEAGKAASCQNNFRYGLTGNSFTVLDFEDQGQYDHVLVGLNSEHQPATMTESILVEKMAQDQCATDEDLTLEEQQRQLTLFIRYQTTHDRAFHRSLNDLLKLRAERRKQEIGFDSQKRKEALESRQAAAEKRRQDLHEFAVLLAEAKVDHQLILNSNLEFDRKIAAAAENYSQEVKQAA